MNICTHFGEISNTIEKFHVEIILESKSHRCPAKGSIPSQDKDIFWPKVMDSNRALQQSPEHNI